MKKSRLLGAMCAYLFTFCLSTPTIAAITAYAQDFEALNAADPAALSNDGYWVWADVWSGDVDTGTYLYNYGGPFPAPNSSATGVDAFSGVATGEGGGAQGTQYLNIFSDYQNSDHANGYTINTSVFQDYVLDAGDVNGDIWTLTFDAKSPFADGISEAAIDNGGNFRQASTSASAFIKTLDPSIGYAATNDIRVDMTNISNTEWATFAISLDLSDAALVGQILQFGFNTVTTEYDNSGVYYDNITFSAVPVPAAVWLFGSGLLGLVGISRRRKTA